MSEFDRAAAAAQDQLQDDLRRVQEYGQEQPQHFGGVYWDDTQPGRIVALFTDEVDRHRAMLHRLVLHPDRLIVKPSPKSWRQLVAEKDAIAAMLIPRKDLGVHGVGIGLDKGNFAIHVDIHPYSAEIADLIRGLIRPYHAAIQRGGPYHAR